MALTIKRRLKKVVKIGNVLIGGKHPIAIQSMIKIPTKRTKVVVKQIKDLEDAGCEIIRVAIRDSQDAKSIAEIKKHIRIPLVADIHFNYKFALEAIESGVDKIRLNPGNIFKIPQVRQIAKQAKQRNIPIRVGANSGSLRDKYLKSSNTQTALVKQTQDYIKVLEDSGIKDIIISLKSSDIFETINAYRKISKLYRYPLHVGVTATGLLCDGIIKSALGIGTLLMEGIGDTIRVSLLDDSLQEIKIAKNILSSLGVGRFGPNYVCCPTCGRCEVDLKMRANELTTKLARLKHRDLSGLTIALMGCMVNGPGEAKHADIGIAFGRSRGLLFRKGKVIRTVDQNNCIDLLIRQLNGG